MNKFEIAWHQRGRVSPEVKRIRPAAFVADNKPKFSLGGLIGAFPGIAEKSRLVICGERIGFRNVDFRRVKLHCRTHHAIEDVLCRDNQQPNRTSVAFRQGDHLREQIALVASGWRAVSRFVVDVNAQYSNGDGNNIPVAGSLNGGDDMSQGIGMAYRDKDIAGTHVDVYQRHIARGRKLEGLLLQCNRCCASARSARL